VSLRAGEPGGWVPPVGARATPAAIEADWVVYGKAAGSSADYGVLQSSSRYFSRVDFGTILRRFSPGTPPARAPGPSIDGLPWATVSYAPLRRPAAAAARRSTTAPQRAVSGPRRGAPKLATPDGPGVLGIAVYNWTELVDVVGRPVIGATYVCAPFEDFATVPVSYLGLFHALTQDPGVAAAVGPEAIRVARGAPPAGTGPATGATTGPTGGPVRLRLLPGLDPGEVAQFLDGDRGATFDLAARVAALLLCQPVALVGERPSGPASRVPERLRFFDAVAALLPYGQRARLVASTWADAGLAHHIRLAYTARPRQGDAVVRMPTHDRPARAQTTLPPAARDYYQTLVDLRQARGVTVEDIVAHLQRPAYRRARAIDDHRNALLSLTDLGEPKIFTARLVPAKALDLDELAEAQSASPEKRQALHQRAEATVVEHAVALLRAQRWRGRLLAGATSAGLDDAVLADLAEWGERGQQVVQELVLWAIDEDLAAVAAGHAAAPGGGPGVDGARSATACTQGWLDWVAGLWTGTLVDSVQAFTETAGGRPGPEAFARDGKGSADARRKALALLRLARLAGCSRMLNEKVWRVVMEGYDRYIPPLPADWEEPTKPEEATPADPRVWLAREKAVWAREIAELPTGPAGAIDDARFDVARILLGALPVSPVRSRMSTVYFQKYTDNVAAAVKEMVRYRDDVSARVSALERVMDGFAASLNRDGWPDGNAAVNTINLLWKLAWTITEGHASPRLRATVTAYRSSGQMSTMPLNSVMPRWQARWG